MGTAVFAATSMFAPLQVLMGRLLASCRLASPPTGVRRRGKSDKAKSKLIADYQENTWTEGHFDSKPATARPLRVVRMVERGHRPGVAGRMVISGRMADVCAELERLEQLASRAATR